MPFNKSEWWWMDGMGWGWGWGWGMGMGGWVGGWAVDYGHTTLLPKSKGKTMGWQQPAHSQSVGIVLLGNQFWVSLQHQTLP